VDHQLRLRLIEKLRPTKIHTSGKFAAILGCLLGEAWTSPQLMELYVTIDGHILARAEGDIGANEFIGAKEDLIANLIGVADVAGLTPEERRALLDLVPRAGEV